MDRCAADPGVIDVLLWICGFQPHAKRARERHTRQSDRQDVGVDL